MKVGRDLGSSGAGACSELDQLEQITLGHLALGSGYLQGWQHPQRYQMIQFWSFLLAFGRKQEESCKGTAALLMWSMVLAGWDCVPGNKYLSSKSILSKWEAVL